MLDDVLPPPALHLPYEAGPQRMALGLTAISEAAWLERDAQTRPQIAERMMLLAERRADILADTPGAEAACAELRAMLAAHLTTTGLDGRHRTVIRRSIRWQRSAPGWPRISASSVPGPRGLC